MCCPGKGPVFWEMIDNGQCDGWKTLSPNGADLGRQTGASCLPSASGTDADVEEGGRREMDHGKGSRKKEAGGRKQKEQDVFSAGS